MLRAIGLNVPEADEQIVLPDYAYLEGYYEDTEPTVMDVAGWHDHLPVDMFGYIMTIEQQIAYAIAIGVDFDE
jgi:hypothetical protein